MTQGSRWHDDFDQPRRHIIDESGNQPVVRQGGDRLEGSHIDCHCRVRIGDCFGQEAFLADTKVARQHVGVPFEVSNPALGVLKNDQVKARGRASFLLGNPPQHYHGLQRRWSDAPPNIPDHDRLSGTQAEHVSRIDEARLHAEEPRQRADHQARSDDQHQRQRDLGDDEHGARAPARAGAPRPVLEGLEVIGAADSNSSFEPSGVIRTCRVNG